MGEYRVNFKLRRRSQAALDHNRAELKSEDYDDDEQFCQAVASELLEMMTADREYLADQEGENDD
jgi:hypothetical protein